TAHGLRTPLSEADIVLPRAPLVGMTLEAHLDVGILREILTMRGQHLVVLRRHVRAIEIEVDDQLAQETLPISEIILEDADSAPLAERARRRARPAAGPAGGTRFEVGQRVCAITAPRYGDRSENTCQHDAGSHHLVHSDIKSSFKTTAYCDEGPHPVKAAGTVPKPALGRLRSRTRSAAEWFHPS